MAYENKKHFLLFVTTSPEEREERLIGRKGRSRVLSGERFQAFVGRVP